MADVVLTEEDLRLLRERCYTRAATADTVAAYLAGLEELQTLRDEEAAAAGTAHLRPFARRRPDGRAAWINGAAALATVIAVFLPMLQTVLHLETVPAVRLGSVQAVRAPLVAPTAPGRLLATLSSSGSWSSGPLEAGGRIVALSTVCRGDGTYDVRIADEAPVTLVCDSSVPALAMLQSEHPLHEFSIVVTATPGQATPAWSFSIGTMPLA